MSLSHDQAEDGKAVFDDFACLHLSSVALRPGAARNRAVSPGTPEGGFGLTGRSFAGRKGAHGFPGAGSGFFLRP